MLATVALFGMLAVGADARTLPGFIGGISSKGSSDLKPRPAVAATHSGNSFIAGLRFTGTASIAFPHTYGPFGHVRWLQWTRRRAIGVGNVFRRNTGPFPQNRFHYVGRAHVLLFRPREEPFGPTGAIHILLFTKIRLMFLPLS